MDKPRVIDLEIVKCCHNCQYFKTEYYLWPTIMLDTYCLKRGLEPNTDNVCDQHKFDK